MSDITLVIPPFTQLNTPYPSITYLNRYLKAQGYTATLLDASIQVATQIFSAEVFSEIFAEIEQAIDQGEEFPEEVWMMLSRKHHILAVLDLVILHLQGQQSSLHYRVVGGSFLPQTPRLTRIDLSYFGTMGSLDASKYLCTLFLEDLSDLIKACIDIGFDFGRYQAHLATGSVTLDPIIERIEQTTLIDHYIDEITDTIETPCVGISIPFAGTLYAALRMGKRLKERGHKVWLGGGYVNTELRSCEDPRVWSYCDALCFDNGEEPLLNLLHRHQGKDFQLIRTKTPEGYFSNEAQAQNPFTAVGDYGDLELSLYIQLLDSLSPAHRIWSDGRWNKFTIAHGCYWKKCSFCDIHLDYISRYVPAQTAHLVDQIEEIIAQTGQRGFHFVDEAAPPKALKDFALEILRRGLQISFWGNIRFEKSYTPDLCALLSKAGLVMVTGGLEVAEERLLAKMNKGVSLEQVIQATHAFQSAGILVHAYLMYGFPSQTEKETLASMEMVRQLFEAKLLDSAFWHRFVLTRHSGVYADVKEYGITIKPQPDNIFATNDIEHEDPRGGDHDIFDEILPYALGLWMRGENLQQPVYQYFEKKMPKIKTPRDFVAKQVAHLGRNPIKETAFLLWTGEDILETGEGVLVVGADRVLEIELDQEQAAWLLENIGRLHPSEKLVRYGEFVSDFPAEHKGKLRKIVRKLRKCGLLFL